MTKKSARLIRAILVDPYACTISYVDLVNSADGRLTGYYSALSQPGQVPVYCIASGWVFENEDVLFVDDNGLLVDQPRFFRFDGMYQPFAGKGLIVGTDSQGDSVDVVTKIEELPPCIFIEHLHADHPMSRRYGQRVFAKVTIPYRDPTEAPSTQPL